MSLQRLIVFALTFTLASGAGSAAAQTGQNQAVGIIGGKASDQAKKPYTDYLVQLRDVATGQRVTSVPLTTDGRFAFTSVLLSKKYLVELYQVKQNQIVCTAGPYTLSAPSLLNKNDVNINCGTNPAVYWLIVAAAGTAAAIALGVRSAGQ